MKLAVKRQRFNHSLAKYKHVGFLAIKMLERRTSEKKSRDERIAVVRIYYSKRIG